MKTDVEILSKRAIGRPRRLENTVTTAFVLTHDADNRLNAYCQSVGISRSEAVRQWIQTLPILEVNASQEVGQKAS